MRGRNAPALAALIGAVVLAGCGPWGPSSSTSPEGPEVVDVRATLSDFKVVLDKSSGKVGELTVAVTGAGPSTHELVAFRTDLAEDRLPIDATNKVDETAPSVKHSDPEAEMVAKGETKTIIMFLPAGKYVFICNLPGHYKLGMHAPFTVVA